VVHSVGFMEQRRHQRIDLGALVRFSWQGSGCNECHGKGITRDLSAGGLFVISDTLPPAASIVEFEVDLESSSLGSAVNIQAKGQVRRVEVPGTEGHLGGFAISARRMKLKRAESVFGLVPG
jgi:PilZ domain